ncbi:hypothetical protein H4R24_002741 [Coemansia sp. RSA 988]|nr:hypothetical protein H4R24_002741 [Coemansia sp. RSA 988]
MHTLVASTSDTIRIWDLTVSDVNKQKSSSTRQHSRLGSTGVVPDNGPGHVHVSTDTVRTTDLSADGIGQILSVSWAADGNTLAVAGKGAFIQQYGRTGELLQNIEPNRSTVQTGIMDVAAVRHYGGNSETLFIANNTKKQVRRWDFVRKEYTSVCQTHENKISCMAVCTKKRMVATATAQGGEIALFNLLHNTRTDLRSATRKALTCIDISLGHKSQVAVGSEEGLLQLFDTTRSGAAPLRSFSQIHLAPMRGVVFHPLNSLTLISAGLDGRLVITDTRLYPSSSRSNSGGALVISAGAPLTCLSYIRDTQIVGAGTLDGDVLLFDSRMAAAPLWQDSVRPGTAVVDMDFAYCANGNYVPESQPLRRSSSVREGPMPSRHITRHGSRRENSYDGTAASLQFERRRIGGPSLAPDAVRRHEERPVKPAPSSQSVDGRGEAHHRPPQHPSISKFRAAVTEHQLNVATGKLSRTAALPSPASPEHCREQRPPTYGNSAASEDFAPIATGTENMSLLAKDRSYMDLLSPAKPGKTTGIYNDALLTPNLKENMLSLLSSNRPQLDDSANVHSSQHSSLDRMQDDFVEDTTANNTQAITQDMVLCHSERDIAASSKPYYNDPSPLPLPQRTKPALSQEHSQTRDTGDSMMEMFTPEREARASGPFRTLADERGHSQPINAKSEHSIPQMLVSQLLNSKHPTQTGECSATDIQANTAVSDIVHYPATSAVTEPPEQRVLASTPSSSKQAPIEAVSRSISSSVFQNAISDALAPVCEQIRGEIRNLHLDILRQGFVYQEQVRSLRQECGEARALRQEIEQLRRENEQLRRYIPFFGKEQGDANEAAWDKL